MNHPFSGILVRYLMRQDSFPGGIDTVSIKNPAQIALPESAAAMKRGVRPDELHVNLWEVRDPSVLDLGIMIGDWKKVEAVVIDLPWDINLGDVEDLGTRLDTEKTVAAIFNEVVNYSGNAGQNYSKITILPTDVVDSTVTEVEATKRFFIFRLPAKSFTIDKIGIGHGATSCRLRVNLPTAEELHPDNDYPLYLRFRINKAPPSVYSSSFELADRNLLSSSTKNRIIDFRINVRRGIPDEILAGSTTLKFPNFKKIHFFLTIGREQICDFESQNFVGCRSLVDEKIWNGYLRSKSTTEPVEATRQYLGYQWTEAVKDKTDTAGSAGVKDLVVMGRFSSQTSNILKTIKFVFFGLVFGMIGNGLWEITKPIGDSFLGTPNTTPSTSKGTYILLAALFTISVLSILPWSVLKFCRLTYKSIICKLKRRGHQ